MKTHKKKGTKIYNIWRGIRDRTRRKSHSQYKDYGGRNITVCEDWEDFENFYNWAMQHGYKEGLTIDRINNNKGYNPENCRFATRSEQNNNKRNNHILTYNGESLNITQWAKKLGVSREVIATRIIRGWSVEKTLTTKPRARKKGVVI